MLCLSQIEQQARAVRTAIGAKFNWNAVELPLHIKNGCNLREHWAARAKRVKKERSVVGHALWYMELQGRGKRPELPCVVTITRLAARPLDDDNNVAGCKAIRDAIAEWLGIDDRDPRVTWRYAQERSKGYACRIQIEGAE